MDTVFICRGAGLELIETGTWRLPDIALAMALKIIYLPCARRAPSLLIRVCGVLSKAACFLSCSSAKTAAETS